MKARDYKTARGRANLAARLLLSSRQRGTLGRQFDACLEQHDADEVLRLIQSDAKTRPELAEAIERHGYGAWLAPDYWSDYARKAQGPAAVVDIQTGEVVTMPLPTRRRAQEYVNNPDLDDTWQARHVVAIAEEHATSEETERVTPTSPSHMGRTYAYAPPAELTNDAAPQDAHPYPNNRRQLDAWATHMQTSDPHLPATGTVLLTERSGACQGQTGVYEQTAKGLRPVRTLDPASDNYAERVTHFVKQGAEDARHIDYTPYQIQDGEPVAERGGVTFTRTPRYPDAEGPEEEYYLHADGERIGGTYRTHPHGAPDAYASYGPAGFRMHYETREEAEAVQIDYHGRGYEPATPPRPTAPPQTEALRARVLGELANPDSEAGEALRERAEANRARLTEPRDATLVRIAARNDHDQAHRNTGAEVAAYCVDELGSPPEDAAELATIYDGERARLAAPREDAALCLWIASNIRRQLVRYEWSGQEREQKMVDWRLYFGKAKSYRKVFSRLPTAPQDLTAAEGETEDTEAGPQAILFRKSAPAPLPPLPLFAHVCA